MATNDAECTVCQHSIPGVVSVLSGKYAIGIVCAVGAHGTCRFGDLEEHFPSASTATLTDEGKELRERCEPLFEWAVERHRA